MKLSSFFIIHLYLVFFFSLLSFLPQQSRRECEFRCLLRKDVLLLHGLDGWWYWAMGLVTKLRLVQQFLDCIVNSVWLDVWVFDIWHCHLCHLIPVTVNLCLWLTCHSTVPRNITWQPATAQQATFDAVHMEGIWDFHRLMGIRDQDSWEHRCHIKLRGSGTYLGSFIDVNMLADSVRNACLFYLAWNIIIYFYRVLLFIILIQSIQCWLSDTDICDLRINLKCLTMTIVAVEGASEWTDLWSDATGKGIAW